MKLIGRDREIGEIEARMGVAQAGLHTGGGPIGCYMLAGPSGCGKTRTVEYMAHKWHGDARSLVRIDCGEFQMEHEVAKLIGAPPGYLGHRETTPMLTQQRLTAMTSNNCNISFVLFDEIEKAAPSMQRILLGVMDKGHLRLGDNTVVNFEKSVLFFTSNLGTAGLFKKNSYELDVNREELREVKESVVLGAIKSYFSTEFQNRLTDVFVYKPLTTGDALEIARDEMDTLVYQWGRALGGQITYEPGLLDVIVERGFSLKFGGRELKRTIQKIVTVPFANWLRELPGKMAGGNVLLGWTGELEISVIGEPVFIAGAGGKGRRR